MYWGFRNCSGKNNFASGHGPLKDPDSFRGLNAIQGL